MAEQKKTSSIWGGRFESKQSDILSEINQSISFDRALYKQDIEASIAHARMLAKQSIIKQEDFLQIEAGLTKILHEIESGEFEFKQELEDIHMNIESRLAEIIGEAAGRLHTARSRNDQVATDFRLYVRSAADDAVAMLEELKAAIKLRASEYADYIVAGFTHLQTAQPVTFGHHLMAYYEMFDRDHSRFLDARKRMNECPLGAAALAGTSFNLDREMTAKELGFARPMRNSMDAVSDRDFALEYLSAASICATHLSRLAEEMVIWSSSQFAFIKLSDAFTTGSSIMPQKRNPDAAELVRGKSGRIYGSLFTLLTVMKGLPLTYSKDMQEDKEPVFDASHTLKLCLTAMKGMILDMQANRDNMRKSADTGYSTATDIADFLVRVLNIPFRKAHHITGSIVKIAEEKGSHLSDLTLEEMQKIEPKITADIFNVLSVESSVNSRKSYGGTATQNVKAMTTKVVAISLLISSTLIIGSCGVKRDLALPKDTKGNVINSPAPVYGNDSLNQSTSPITDGNPTYLPPNIGKGSNGSF